MLYVRPLPANWSDFSAAFAPTPFSYAACAQARARSRRSASACARLILAAVVYGFAAALAAFLAAVAAAARLSGIESSLRRRLR